MTVTPMGLTDLGAEFLLDRPYTCCCICGKVFQSKLDRTAITLEDQYRATERRKRWSHKHAKTHTTRQHRDLERSGAFMTPDAAMKLASFGIISVADMSLNNEHWNAGRESHRVPHNDAEG